MIRTLFGEPLALDTAGGFTVWRVGTPLAVLVGAWALTTATRVTRGEEAAGRWSLLLAGVPVALVSLGAALAALGWAPRAVLALGALPAAGGFLLTVLADSFGWPGWMRALSPYAHVAAVPGAPADLAGAGGLLVMAAVLGSVGVVGFRRRDLRA